MTDDSDKIKATPLSPEIPEKLLKWYRVNARILPWRDNPSPYYVWVSEIMLQQTRVEAVKPYFERFILSYPTVEALARAKETELLKAWEGLGYYSRARNLCKAAKIITERYNGSLPPSYEDLLCLPGIGEYTAGAIASIAFGIPVPAVDGNVLRVCARLTGSYDNIALPEVKKHFRDEIQKILSGDSKEIKDNAGAFNQAMMELGATVCLPNGAPLCGVCPLSELCSAKERKIQSLLPVKSAKKKRKKEERTVYLILSENKIALRRRFGEGLLSNMWEFPNVLTEKSDQAFGAWKITALNTEKFGEAKHIFTHIEWHMQGILVTANQIALPEGWVWADRKELAEIYPIPNAFKFFIRQLLKENLL